MMHNDTPADPSDDFIAILGTRRQRPARRLPAAHDPDGLQRDDQRRTLNVSVNGNAYDERNLIGVAYVIEQAHEAAQAGSARSTRACTAARKTVPAPPFAARGALQPGLRRRR